MHSKSLTTSNPFLPDAKGTVKLSQDVIKSSKAAVKGLMELSNCSFSNPGASH